MFVVVCCVDYYYWVVDGFGEVGEEFEIEGGVLLEVVDGEY